MCLLGSMPAIEWSKEACIGLPKPRRQDRTGQQQPFSPLPRPDPPALLLPLSSPPPSPENAYHRLVVEEQWSVIFAMLRVTADWCWHSASVPSSLGAANVLYDTQCWWCMYMYTSTTSAIDLAPRLVGLLDCKLAHGPVFGLGHWEKKTMQHNLGPSSSWPC